MGIRYARRRSASSRTRATDGSTGRAGMVRRLSAALRTARTGAAGTTGALQALPDSTLIGVAAGSLGVGTGFYLARAPRLAVVAGIAPALLMVAAIVLRPIRPRVA
jgi:hypothetical protein